jgi:D-serine deaminase-like pyridoxal phosphate-dependent protein
VIASSKPAFAPAAAGTPNVLRGDFLLPVLVLKRDAVRHNVDVMARYCAAHGASLAPHGKTTMAPQLLQLQLAAGAWGITAATAAQAIAFRAQGIETILIANELVEPAAIAWAAQEVAADPSCRIVCLADSLAGVSIMADAVQASGADAQLEVLVELGFAGGRTGCRSLDEAIEVATAVAAAPSLRLAGTECYEGTIAGATMAETVARVDALLADLGELTATLDRRGAFSGSDEILVSAGGSAFFDRVVATLAGPWELSLPVRLVLRSGCYVTHDSGVYRALSPFDGRGDGSDDGLRPALELWGAVLSLPEPGLAIVGFGKRDAPHDMELPVPEQVRRRDGRVAPVAGLAVAAVNDQHAYVRGDCSDLEVGDWLGCGISHPCTAFDKWRRIPLVDDDYTVVDTVETLF